MLVGGLALLALSLALSPDWPRHWVAALHEPTYQRADRPIVLTTYVAPVLQPGGLLVLLALLKRRRPEARLLVALACTPQTPVAYEMVPLVLVATARIEILLLTVLSWGIYAALLAYRTFGDWSAIARISGVAEVWLLLIPATLLVLRRPNVGEVAPPVAHRALRRQPTPIDRRETPPVDPTSQAGP
jgi:hypothetical protein